MMNEMANELKVKSISGVNQHVLKIEPDKDRPRQDPRKKKKKPAKVRKHFDKLAKTVEKAHEVLVKENSPYRFCVYKKDGEVMIDVVTLTEEGKIDTVYEQNISHEEFMKWVHHVEEGSGLIFDKNL